MIEALHRNKEHLRNDPKNNYLSGERTLEIIDQLEGAVADRRVLRVVLKNLHREAESTLEYLRHGIDGSDHADARASLLELALETASRALALGKTDE